MTSRTSASPAHKLSLCLVGAGNMGGAMLGGWLSGGHDAGHIHIIDPSLAPAMAEMAGQHGVRVFADAKDAPGADVVIVAVKPQMMEAVLPQLAGIIKAETVVVSVAAGTSIATLETSFAAVSPKVIRCMPNTPAMVQRGVTVCVGNSRVNDDDRANVTALMEAIGTVEWVEDEGLIDAVTGVSGSGPAYVFYLAEVLAQAGEAAGLPADLAKRLARSTVCGAGELMHQSPLEAATLRENVTSPNGTTAAALGVLMADDGMTPLMEKAVSAATKRSRELG